MSSDWMKSLDGRLFLGQLSIPGTHDSTTWKMGRGTGTEWHRCQNLTIDKQLEMGVRYFDIRVDLRWAVCHGKGGKKAMCNVHMYEIVDSFRNFLSSEKSKGEVLLVRIKHEDTAGSDEEFLDGYNKRIKGESFWWKRPNSKEIRMPRLEDVRGKAIIFDQMGSSKKHPFKAFNDGYGFKWDNSSIWAPGQDSWKELNPEKKRDLIVAEFNNVTPMKFSINHVSASGRRGFKTTPSHHDSAIYPKIMEHLLKHPNQPTGVLVWDYIDDVHEMKFNGDKIKPCKVQTVIARNSIPDAPLRILTKASDINSKNWYAIVGSNCNNRITNWNKSNKAQITMKSYVDIDRSSFNFKPVVGNPKKDSLENLQWEITIKHSPQNNRGFLSVGKNDRTPDTIKFGDKNVILQSGKGKEQRNPLRWKICVVDEVFVALESVEFPNHFLNVAYASTAHDSILIAYHNPDRKPHPNEIFMLMAY